MEIVQIFNLTRQVMLAHRAEVALSLSERMKGLLGRDSLAPGEAMILKPCPSIHTFGMRFNIDVLFLDKSMQIIKLIQNMPANRHSPIVLTSQMVIELPAGTINQTGTQHADTIEIRK